MFKDIRTGIRGTLRDTVTGTVAVQHPLARRALERNGTSVTRDVLDAGRGLLEGTFASGEEWRITTTRMSGDVVEFAIQVGAFGDQERQRTILEWIRAER